MTQTPYSLDAYNYTLPDELIAQEAVHPHHDARMMIIDRMSGEIIDERQFHDLPEVLDTDSVFFFNDSRVIPSRITLHDIPYSTSSGETHILGEGEIFYLNTRSEREFEALVRPGNRFKIGTTFEVGNSRLRVTSITESGRTIELLDESMSIEEFLISVGSLPLPPYITYSKEKEKDYQTSFAKNNGSVAAPTASLHFTEELMSRISNQKEYLTLHVGLGTFKGIQTTDIRDYQIHREKIEIDRSLFSKIANLRKKNTNIIAVGTTATRTLESLPSVWQEFTPQQKSMFDPMTHAYWQDLTRDQVSKNWIHNMSINESSLKFETSIYIVPGYEFLIVDSMITNFHIPGSSLLVLISAFLGYESTMEIYRYAIEKKYRFYSFGDGMYIQGKAKKCKGF